MSNVCACVCVLQDKNEATLADTEPIYFVNVCTV